MLFNRFRVYEFEAGLLYRHGVFLRQLKAGETKLFGKGYECHRIDLREKYLVVSGQEILTNDLMPVKVSITLTYRIADAKMFHQCSHYTEGLLTAKAQIALREVFALFSFDQTIGETGSIQPVLLEKFKPLVESVGAKVVEIAIRDVMVPGPLRKAHLALMIAKKEGEASLERARAESATLRSLLNSAHLIKEHPELAHIRTIQALEAGKGSSVVLDLTKK
jgi:regulator of protease activity HflC (stomatin/prohibitin superfamily)